MESNLEIWKDIPEYEGLYQCSSFGQVRSLDRYDCRNRRINGIVMKQSKCSTGYIAISLWKNGVKKDFKAHQLVAMCFLGHKQRGLELVINHKNSNRVDNNLSNLEIVTNRYNCQHGKSKVLNRTSYYFGVVFREKYGIYQSSIVIDGEKIYLGVYKNEEDAGRVYIEALESYEQGRFKQYYNSIIEKRLSKQTSRHEGVCYIKASGKWSARVNVNGNRIRIGVFDTENEAYIERLNYMESNNITSRQRQFKC